MVQYAWLIPLLPLLAFAAIVFLTGRARMLSAIVALTAAAVSFIMSAVILGSTLANPVKTEVSLQWLNISSVGPFRGLSVEMGLLIDPLSSIMLFVVTFVAVLVILYSIGYMHGDKGFSRYFAYFSLFEFSMLGLVIANNYFQMFVFWELVGLCSYLLIGFWYHKDSAADASKKAFITNRWADFGFMVGIIILFIHFGTFNFGQLVPMIKGSADLAFITLAGILIIIGPIGKSAQFPLHVWLPDAMEGPTPVSAFIHAATMVAAGVFLIARGYALFAGSTSVMTFIAYIGGFTAIFAASIALVQHDIKRILAYSTLSQLGYMVMAMGVGSMTAGMFHLTTHAFFKALLFLGAGSVIHALDEQNIFKMGGLKNKMPVTTWTFVIASLALAGIFPLSGFWSKDEILAAALQNHFTGLFIVAMIVAFMTAFYMFRLIFIAFFGEKRSDYHAHESPWVMTLPLVLLSIFAVFLGLVNSPWFYDIFGRGFGSYIFFGEPEVPHVNMAVAIVSTLLALGGIFLAWLMYAKKTINAEAISKRFSGLYKLLWNKYYIDEIYGWLFDRVMLVIGKVFDWIDHYIIDGFFDGIANLVRVEGGKLRFLQTGFLQTYALIIFAAVAIIYVLLSTPLLGGLIR